MKRMVLVSKKLMNKAIAVIPKIGTFLLAESRCGLEDCNLWFEAKTILINTHKTEERKS